MYFVNDFFDKGRFLTFYVFVLSTKCADQVLVEFKSYTDV